LWFSVREEVRRGLKKMESNFHDGRKSMPREISKNAVINYLTKKRTALQKELIIFFPRCSHVASKMVCSRVLTKLEDDGIISRWRKPDCQRQKVVELKQEQF